jgi:8-oxo-dGTP pyrophosphatase MutT (NUDIX family)
MFAFHRIPQNPAVELNPFIVVGRGGKMGAVVAIDAWGNPIIGEHKPFEIPPFPSFFGGQRQAVAVPAPPIPSAPRRETHGPYITMDELEAREAKMTFPNPTAGTAMHDIPPIADFVDPFSSRPVAKAAPRPAAKPVAPVVHAKSVSPPHVPTPSHAPLCSGCKRCERGAASAGCLIIVVRGSVKYILLGRSAHDGTYSDLGGRRDHGERIYTTAAREVYEESAYTIDMSIPRDARFVDTRPSSGVHFHRCYIVRNDDVKYRNFKSAIAGGHLPHVCLEMDRLTLFPISELRYNRSLLSRNQAINKKGKTVQLSNRAVNVITAALNRALL